MPWRYLSLALVLAALPAQADPTRAGVICSAPLIDCGADTMTGPAVALWRSFAEGYDWSPTLIPLTAEDGPQRLADGSVDVLIGARVEASVASRFLLSPAYSYEDLLVVGGEDNLLLRTAHTLLSPDFYFIAVSICALWLVIGLLIWIAECRSNPDQFGGHMARGVGSGFWWAGVTMTTIGYGDKAPITIAGRALALLWMLLAMVITASLTAALVGASGLSSQQTVRLDDLRDQKIVIVEESPAGQVLRGGEMAYERVDDSSTAIRAIRDGTYDFLIAGESRIPTTELRVRPLATPGVSAAIAFRDDGFLPAGWQGRLLEIRRDPAWLALWARYQPEG